MCMWMSGDRLRELALSFYHRRTGERIQVTGLGDKCLSPLSQLAGPSLSHKKKKKKAAVLLLHQGFSKKRSGLIKKSNDLSFLPSCLRTHQCIPGLCCVKMLHLETLFQFPI